MSLVLSSVRETLYAVTSCCFPNPTLHINRRTFKVIKLLGEGGFSYVYLVQDTSTGRYYALKKILCQFGSDSVKDAMKEVEMYKLFSHENIIKVIDTCVVQDKNGGKIVYIFLPYYKSGNLQDAINNNLEHDRHFGEREMLKIFRGICYAVRTLHTYRFPSVPLRSENELSNSIINGMENGMNNNNSSQSNDLQNEDDIVPFAHRDIKPGNILLSDDLKTPILMDFGSLVRARIKIQSHNEALMHQDAAAQYSTMSYRAPELFDVKTELNEKVDIWSLGCTLYAMAYGQSPFESSVNEQGGSIALTVLNAQFRFPTAEQDKYSSELKDLISFMLKVDPKDRPDIHDVITKVDTLLEQLSS